MGQPVGQEVGQASLKDLARKVLGEKSRKISRAPSAPAAPTKSKHLTPSMLHAWKTARPWLLDHLPQLQAAGWTRDKLFRAGRLRFPFGPWGVAFLPTWTKDGVQIEIEDRGAIRFSWIDKTGRPVSQAARPKH